MSCKHIYHLFLILLLAGPALGQTYNWGNVAVGGGGYTIGVKIHPQNSNLIYVRTDVGGLYRWDNTKGTLVQLFNWVTAEQDNLYGIAGIALHPTNQSIVYAGAGKYAGFTPHGVFKSSNQGGTWTNLNLPVTNAFDVNNGNTDHRFGNPVEVNPHNANQLWVGTVSNGVYVYNESTSSWSQVSSIPTGLSVRNIEFDKVNANNVYVGIRGKGVYRSTNGGSSFSLIPGSDTFTIQDMDLSKNGDKLFLATETQGIKRLDNASTGSTWLTKTPGSSLEFRGLATSPHDNNVVITCPKPTSGLNQIYLSSTSGDSWTEKPKGTVTQIFPWHPSGYPGSAISQFAFDPDPANAGRVYFTDWYSFWKTDNIFAATVNWTNDHGKGHEEVVNLSMAAPPANSAGVVLYTGFADVSGFRHTNITAIPSQNIRMATSGAGGNLNDITGIDYSENNPSFVAIASEDKHAAGTGAFSYSNNSGQSFTLSSGYSAAWGYARVAVATSPSVTATPGVVAATKSDGVKYSTNGGQSWAAASGTPTSANLGVSGGVFSYVHPLAADRVSANTFYLYNRSNGQVLRSTNGGQSFAALTTWVASTSVWSINVEAAPGVAGHVWGALGGNGLYRWNGTSSTKISNVAEARLMSLGKPAPNTSYPAIYLYGKLTGDTESWIYRSTDQGASWTKINDVNNRVGDSPQIMEADRQVYGRVYIGTNGTGVWYGEVSSSTADTQAPTAPTNLTSPGKTSTSVSLSWTASTDNVGVTGYEVYRGTTLAGTTTSTSYTVTGLSASTAYSFTVKAKDAAGNLSAASNSVSVTTSAATSTSTTYEAEAGTLSGPTVATSWGGYTGTGYLDYPNYSGAYNQWSVSVSSAGTYTLEFRYTNGSGTNRPLSLSVNSTTVNSSLAFNATATWGTWATTTASVSLNAGSNTVRLTATAATGPDIDHLKVSGVGARLSYEGPAAGMERRLVYPNPAAGKVTVRYHAAGRETVRLRLLSPTSVGVRRLSRAVEAGTHEIEVDLTALPEGLYLLEVAGSAGTRTLHKVAVTR